MRTHTLSTAPTRLTRNRDYLAWLAADTSWQFGSAVHGFAMTLICYAVTGSYAQAGAIATVSTIVSMVVMVPGGVLVDRWDRRRSLMISCALRMVVYAAAATAWWAGVLTAPLLYAVGVASGVVTGLFSGASDAALRSVVGTADLPRAVASNQGRDGAVSLAAPPLSGLLMGASYALPFLTASIGSLLQILCTRRIRADLRPRHDRPSPGQDTWHQEMLAGFRTILGSPLLRRILPALILVNAGLNALYTGVTLILTGRGVPAWRIGLIDSVMAVGMLIGAVLAQRLISRVPTGRLVVTIFIACTAVLVPVALTQSVPVVLACFGVLGLLVPAVNGAMGGYLQAIIPDELQGRALAAMHLVQMTLPGLMPAAAGVALQHLGAGPTMAATLILFPAAAILMATHRELRALPTPDRWEIGTVEP
ncbi:MAG: MFS transporter [Acidipropionibacterium acidipropionici]|jgi:MFS family permease|uniref:MFS transporter n=1 Tax=Acidipropionibacterium acidipropionici TaxID=1748 RepID=UPI002F354265